ncbi:MAG: hypothetical protein OEZ43_01470 [Gammaproteobacteria bacterium]|nr:hypothetical protein [Gammaproteobacteria bacterium]
MVNGYCRDVETGVVNEVFAIIYAPKRKRDRYPENCVQIQESEHEALNNADPTKHWYAAKVVGPARSSEGLRLFYLVAWLSSTDD